MNKYRISLNDAQLSATSLFLTQLFYSIWYPIQSVPV
jgi:hypothetical protein